MRNQSALGGVKTLKISKTNKVSNDSELNPVLSKAVVAKMTMVNDLFGS